MSELSDYEIEKIVFELSQKMKCLEWSRMNNFADGMKYMRDYFKNDERHTCEVVRSEYDAVSILSRLKSDHVLPNLHRLGLLGADLSIEDKVSKLYDLVKIQVKCSRQDLSDQYMRGMANGLICALAVFKEWEPIYIEKRTELEITHANQLHAIKFCPSKKKHGEVICPKCMPIFKALDGRR